jgi:C4-dicarboxylate-specific signal transduction histidine kinase
MNTAGEKPAEGAQADLARELHERVKELNCLFGFSDIVEQSGGSLDRVLEETVELLPPSWEHSDIACARILLAGREVCTPNYRESPWKQQAAISVRGQKAGTLELSYLEERPPRDEGPFTREERRLLNAVAERLGHVVERLSAEERLREREDELRERMTHLTRVSTMGEMASSIAHEVNQPLTAIATYAQAGHRLMEGGLAGEDEILQVLGRIADEAIRAGSIIHRLRALVGKREETLVESDLGALLEEILPLASADARLHDIDLHLDIQPELPRVLADGIQIQQVILNLIRNGIDAMEHTPSPHRAITVRLARRDEEGVELSVSDRGAGLPKVDDETLFEPFFTTKEEGMGMGLSISRSIITMHGGRLGASSNPKGGTTFSFTLPTAGESEDE